MYAPGLAADPSPRGGRTRHRREAQGGYQAGGKHFKVHIDGYDATEYVKGETDESPREWFFYTNDDG